jgi:hypothetical protein
MKRKIWAVWEVSMWGNKIMAKQREGMGGRFPTLGKAIPYRGRDAGKKNAIR